MILPLGMGKSFGVAAALAIGAAYWAMRSHDVGLWLPIAAATGTFLHLVGDMLTKEGVPLLWPVPLRLAVPVLGHTESARETVLGCGLSLAILYLGYVSLLAPMAQQAPALARNLHAPSVPAIHVPTSLPSVAGSIEAGQLTGGTP
jgi:hypothetical protein